MLWETVIFNGNLQFWEGKNWLRFSCNLAIWSCSERQTELTGDFKASKATRWEKDQALLSVLASTYSSNIESFREWSCQSSDSLWQVQWRESIQYDSDAKLNSTFLRSSVKWGDENSYFPSEWRLNDPVNAGASSMSANDYSPSPEISKELREWGLVEMHLGFYCTYSVHRYYVTFSRVGQLA